MNKPILIDALHITMGGGKVLLEYLVDNLVKRQVAFHLLRDERCPELQREAIIGKVFVMSDSGNARKKFYEQYRNDYSSVFCFGNIPAPIKMPCPVHTYVHNVNLLKIPQGLSFKRKIKTWLKQKYIAFYAKNTDTWIVQTQNTEDCLRQALPCKGKLVLQLPFYNIPETLKEVESQSKVRTDYILVGDYTRTRGHNELVEAWVKLAEKGYTPTLHLTLSNGSDFPSVVEEANKRGAHIINHGIVPFEELAKLYSRCKATVYPSINESLGLGIIEAIEAGCDVIGTDLPYLHSICMPSATFSKQNADAIAAAVLRYESKPMRKSRLTTENKLNELIDTILQNEKVAMGAISKPLFYQPSSFSVGSKGHYVQNQLWKLVRNICLRQVQER